MRTPVSMKTIIACISILSVLLFVYPLYCRAENDAPPEPLSIVFTPAARPDGELLFTFSQPMAPQEALETAPLPNVLFEPELKGILTWRWTNELVFTPQPGELPRGRRVRITIPEAAPIAGADYALQTPWQIEFAVPGMELAGKVASWPVIQGHPRFMDILNWHSGWVGRGPLFLLYDQPVSVEAVQRLLTVKQVSPERPLEIQVFRPDNAEQVFEGVLNLEYLVAVRVLGLPETGEALSISIPSWKDAEKPEIIRMPLTVNATFELTQSYRGRYYDEYDQNKRVPLNTSWYFQFNNRFNPDLFTQAFHIEPKPLDVAIYAGGWLGVRVYLDLEPGTRYHITVDRTFTDILGNPLTAEVDVSFKSRDLPPQLTMPRGPLLLEREARRIPIQVRNVEQIETHVFRFASPQDFMRAFAQRDAASAEDFGLRESVEQLHFVNEQFEPNIDQLLDLPLEVAPGLLAVEVRAFGSGSEARGMLTDVLLVQTTDLGMTVKVYQDTVFAWITRLHTAAPVEGAAVALYDEDGLIGKGQTDNMGGVYLSAPEIASRAGLRKPLYVVAEKLGYTAVARLVDNELTQPWMFNLQTTVEGSQKLPAAVFTERGVYRPGETVHLKCIVNTHASQQAEKIDVQIKDARGQQVLNKTLVLDRYGSASLDMDLKAEAAVGTYQIQVSQEKQTTTQAFLVEEYRVPTFQVHVSREQDAWIAGEDNRAIIAAEYLHGGSLAGREVQWEVLRTPVLFSSSFFPGYVFELGEAQTFAGTVASDKERLDGQGQFPVTFQADHPANAGPMRYVVEAAVTDVDRQTYAGRLGQVIHPSDVYVGVLPPSRSVLAANDRLDVPVVAVDSADGAPRTGVPVHVSLERLDYHTTARMSPEGLVQMLNRTVPIKQQQYDLITEEAPVNCQFTFLSAGLYLVRVSAQNCAGQTVQAGFQVVVSGDKSTAWPRFDQERIEVVTDKSTYQIGDIARLVVQSPYKQAQGLLTIERDGILMHRVFTIADDTPVIEVPITPEFAPNAYVSVVLLRGRIHHEKDASGFETGAPGFKIGYANLTVDPSQQHLSVDVQPAERSSHPGQTLTVTLEVRDAEGAPTSGQATVMVVDEAVLGLTGYRTPDILSKLYLAQTLGVRTATSILDLPHARRSRNEKVFPGGDQDSAILLLDDNPESLRKLFKSTAYWNPQLPVADDGTAMFTFDLPDNLTTYRIMAVVTDEDARAGSADAQILVRKPLMIQPAMPRFLYPHDELRVDAQVFNQTGNSGEVRMQVQFDGLTLTKGENSTSLLIDTEQSGLFHFPATVTGEQKAVLRFTAELGEYSDAMEVALPILNPGNQRVMFTSMTVLKEAAIPLELPTDYIPGSVQMEATVSGTALSELKDAVSYLMDYPHGCIEQTTSTAYPLVVLEDLLPEIGIEVNRENLKKFSEAGVRRILSFQTLSGGLSYWPGESEPHAFGSAFGATVLIEAKKRDYAVPDDVLTRLADYLEMTLKQTKFSREMRTYYDADADTSALFVMTLGRLGRPQPGYASVLWNQREYLSPFGLSWLAVAVKEMQGEQQFIDEILAELRKAAVVEGETAYFTGKRPGDWSFGSPLRSHAAALTAFALSAPSDELTIKLLKGLLARRKRGLWGNTQENVFSIMGVHAVVTSTEKLHELPESILTINGTDILKSDMLVVSDRVQRILFDESALPFLSEPEKPVEITVRNPGGLPLFFKVRTQYAVPLTSEHRQPQANGFRIIRNYETLDGISLENQPLPAGSLVRVRLNIHADSMQHYVAIDDKLPAGLEPLNMNLATTEKVAMGEFNAVLQRSLSVLSYHEIRDSRVAFYVDEMLPGEYEFVYVARATTPGRFLRPAARIEAMYQPEIYGTTSIDEVSVVAR